ncbi:MAG: CDP-diacylglycerol--glycerol-3-phosphate 3-phosphatidyltransferase, partial [Candidatus Omnitrophica bacterium]|nr:CDP-diacylglycerol--glycerol-3-phosphate 3-phosphatidyltransferase [Candidatus Omnitrophota bacterium]
ANKITMFRIFLTAVFILFLIWWEKIWWTKLISLLIFSLAALSDFLDGLIAKRRNMITDFGKLMDPIADKILVLAAFAAFLQLQIINVWMFMVIISREILITSLRLFALNKGKVLSASKAGKHKTASQMVVIFFILVFVVFQEVMKRFFVWNPNWDNFFKWSIYLLMLFTVGVTLYSGLSYLWENRKIIAKF